MSKAAELAALIGSQSSLSNKNMIINGAMQVAQRSTSVASLGTANGYNTVDRWQMFVGASASAGRFTQSQASVTDLAGFPKSLKHEVTTADTSIAAGEVLQIAQLIEGQNLQSLKKGYSDAKSFTVSFYVKGTANTYVVEMYDNDNTRHVAKTFSVTSSWSRVELTFPADTTGKFDNDNAVSLYLIIWLHAGSDFTSGTLPATWASVTNANRAVGAGSLFSATSNTFEITGVQLEVGAAATPFEHKKYAEDLKDCLRYFYRLKKTNAYGEFCTLRTYSSDDGTGIIYFPQPMRVQPTLTIDKTVNSTNFAYSLNSIAIAASDVNVTQVGIAAASSSASAFVTGGGATIQSNGAGGAIEVSFDFSSEL